ncbi:MAG TPA: type IV pilin [Methanosarcina sp.]|nr:type IV pilin [Methanosarcina sp.]
MGKNFPIVELSEEKGVAPVIGTVISIAIVFILTFLVSSVVFEEYGDSSHKKSPVAKLQIFFTEDGSSLEFEHDGGDPLFFDSSSLSVIMDINNTSYLLNDSALGTFEAGEKKILELNKSLQSPIELKPGDFVSVKVVDYESGSLITKRELEVKRQTVVVPK